MIKYYYTKINNIKNIGKYIIKNISLKTLYLIILNINKL